MTQSKHTPGPWEVERTPLHLQVAAFETSGAMAGNRWMRLVVESRNPEMDAALVAAAPDLLAALKKALLAMKTPYGLSDAVSSARAAIAKAEGREP